ncbi:phage integrase domain/SAM domain-containing protein [Mycobacteroides abscessus subsp. bolletii]|nr:phage integrase domain/SAM domain-containing protein [Mycobacteroides abscessus subsp. bolletii]SHZ08528.1 phage integrase domain/SAM domain-containing protein [Mycobacteroides abscessus subsp. bolletii]
MLAHVVIWMVDSSACPLWRAPQCSAYVVAVVFRSWKLCHFPAEMLAPSEPLRFVPSTGDDWAEWLQAEAIPAGTPFLLSPTFEYDVALNEFFLSAMMIGTARNTQVGYARDIKAFLNFLWRSRNRTDWRDASSADHMAYLVWRRKDPTGPRIDDATWDREVAAVNQFYLWQVAAKNIVANPIPQRARRPLPAAVVRRGRGSNDTTAATYSHGAGRDKFEWLTHAAYLRWRDVGIRGYTRDGLPDSSFRGRWAARNALFCDVMVRTGLRLTEQSALTIFEMPLDRGLGGHQRFWLTSAIAKGTSARWVYVPESLVAAAIDYALIDRADVVDRAREAERYRAWRHPFVVEDPDRRVARRPGGERVKIAQLDPDERLNLLVDGPDGLGPGVFWLSEHGGPLRSHTWKQLFRDANVRCRRHGVGLRAHPHMLRHSYAVITLEQLQRGHIAGQTARDGEARQTYTRVFGDPLDWVRRRLGHRSVVTTQTYLHALAELEMETRMALVPDDWDDPRDIPADRLDERDIVGAPA